MVNSKPNELESFLNFLHAIEEESRVESMCPDFHWGSTFAHADKLGISSLLYFRMKQGGTLDRVPLDIVERYKSKFYWNQARNMKRFAKLRDVLGAFSLEKIPVIALKGLVLAEIVYPHIGLRPMRDVDLLVQEEDLTKAEEILVSLGFHANERIQTKEWYRLHHHHIVPYVSSDRSLVVEVHRQLTPFEAPIKIPIHDLWARSSPVQITGKRCLNLSPEDLLIHLSLHLAVDSYIGKMKGIYDLVETIKYYQKNIDWDRFLELARDYKISKYLYYAFWLAKSTLGVGMPNTKLEVLKSQFRILPYEDQAIKKMLRKGVVLYEPHQHPFYTWILSSGCLDILSNQTRIEKIRNILHRSFKRYRKFSYRGANKAGVSPTRFLMLSYPMYLLRKAMGLSGPFGATHSKRS